jgi:gamma-glutamyl phosphate reductase
VEAPNKTTVKAINMPIGSIGIIYDKPSVHARTLVMRIYSGLIDLRNPHKAWISRTAETFPDFDIELLAPGSKVIIEQE